MLIVENFVLKWLLCPNYKLNTKRLKWKNKQIEKIKIKKSVK